MQEYNYQEAKEASSYIKHFINEQPKTAIVSGTGLGEIADMITDKIIIDIHNIPNWPISTVTGHEGNLIIGKIESRNVIMLQGRQHYYEGYSMKAVTFPIRVLGMLGVQEIILTNSSGAINTHYKTDEIIAVKDHVNLMGMNPLVGVDEPRWNERFPDMSSAYDKDMLAIFASMGLKQGVYAAFIGPSFETPAEINMARIIGADLAGMSTVPEVIVANAMGMKVAVLSCVSNMAAGVLPDKRLTLEEILECARESSRELARIIVELIKHLNQE